MEQETAAGLPPLGPSQLLHDCLLLGIQWGTAGLLESCLVHWEAAPSSCLKIFYFNLLIYFFNKCALSQWKLPFVAWHPCGCGHKHCSLKA